MQADGLEWGEGSRPLGRQGLEEIMAKGGRGLLHLITNIPLSLGGAQGHCI